MYEWLITEYDVISCDFCPNCKHKWLVTRWKHNETGWKQYGKDRKFTEFEEARNYCISLLRKERHKLGIL